MTRRGLKSEVSARAGLRVCIAAIGSGAAFNRGAFLIVIPGFDQQKRKRFGAVVVALIKIESLVEGFAAGTLHVAIESPLRSGIIESWPRSSDGNLVGMFVLHGLVEIIEIGFAPVAAIGGPSAGSGLHPGVGAGEIVSVLRRRLILVNQKRGTLPTAAMFANFIPIDVAALGEDKDNGMAVVGEIGIAILRFRANVFFVSYIE